jgi:hypothetical protein
MRDVLAVVKVETGQIAIASLHHLNPRQVLGMWIEGDPELEGHRTHFLRTAYDGSEFTF